MTKNINNLVTSVKIDLIRINEKNKIALNTFKIFITSNKVFFDFNNKPLKTKAFNTETNLEQDVVVNNWRFKNDTLFKNASFLNSLSLSLQNELIIAQKTKDGFFTLSASNGNLEQILIPYSSNIAFTIENGEIYNGKLRLNEMNYSVTAIPLYIDGKIGGMLMALIKSDFSQQLSELFGSQVYFKRGYPFAMNLSGTLVLHPTLPGSSIKNSKIYKEILSTRNTLTPVKIDYVWPENSSGEKKIMLVKYIEDIELFVGATYYKKDFKPQFDRLKYMLILAVILSTIILAITLIFISNYYSKKNVDIYSVLRSLAKGIIPDKLVSKKLKNNELLLTPDSLLITNYSRLQSFTEKLKNFDYSYDYEKWSNNDIVGDNLIFLNNYLRNQQQQAIEKSKEQERLIWLNEGMSKFIEILKYQVIEIKQLAYKIVSQIVEYINANEGGFFIVNEDESGKYIELLAAYSMHKEKLLNRRIEMGVGFVGRVALEKKTLMITEIPESYSKISTALGSGKPKSIVILPLLFNEDVIGVIELSSFEILSDLQLQFLERISENISANLAMWRASQQTAELLKESQEQTVIQKKQQETLQLHLKELENLRGESEQREIELNSIIKAVDTTALLVEYDRNGQITSANSRFLDTLGRTSDEIVGKHHRDFTSMDVNSPEYKEFWKQLLEGKTKRFLESFHLQDSMIWLSQNYVPILDKDDTVFKILNIAIDITENKMLERQLRDQVREISKEARTVRKEQRKVRKEREEFINKENAYNAIISSAENFVGHVEFTVDGNILYVNKYFAEKLNYDIETISQKNIKDLVNNKDFELFKLALEKAKSGDTYSSKINFLNLQKDLVHFEYVVAPALNVKNKVDKIILTTKIIT